MNTRRINNTTRQSQQARHRLFFTEQRRPDEQLDTRIKAIVPGR
jgi:hypothetical protein